MQTYGTKRSLNMKHTKKIVALLLAVLMLISCTAVVFRCISVIFRCQGFILTFSLLHFTQCFKMSAVF